MTTSEIQGHLEEIYGVEVSPELISTVTDGVIEEVRAWQSRPLEKLYIILYLDALVMKFKQDGRIANRSIARLNAMTFRRSPLLAVAWNGWFGARRSSSAV